MTTKKHEITVLKVGLYYNLFWLSINQTQLDCFIGTTIKL